MLSSDKNVETLSQLIEMLKHNIELRTEYVKLDATAKVVRLLSVATLAVLFFIIFMAVWLFASAAVAVWLSHYWGLTAALFAVAAFYAAILLLIYLNRKAWIERPLVKFLTNLLTT
jgi:uncharacterized membrane protein YgcG